jgi:hypothetical protein
VALVCFDLATGADDAALRRILAANAMPGKISLSFEREPCYFAAARLEGPFHQTMVGRAQAGTVVGMGSRAVRLLHVNGEPVPVGYMSLLRVDPGLAWGSALPRVLTAGWGFYRALHDDGRAPYYLVSVMEGNRAAERLLAAGLRGWPRLQPVTRWVTHAVAVGRRRSSPALPSGLRVEAGRPDLLPGIIGCLRRAGAQRQLAPVWSAADLAGDQALPGLNVTDFWVVLQEDEVVGCAARWNQQAVKQTVVRGYGRALRWARPFINSAARLQGGLTLPPVGEPVRHVYLSHLAAATGDAQRDCQVQAALLAAAYNAAVAAGDSFLLVGVAADDPLDDHVRGGYRTIPLPSRLFLAYWEGCRNDEAAVAAVDGRSVGVEIALL